MAFTVDGSNGLTFPDSTSMASATQLGLRNRIINGAMMIDQRNAGASVTANDSVFAVDRFRFSMTASSKGTGQRSTVAPAGFTNSLLFTSSAATTVAASDQYGIVQPIEGFNVSDLGWGAVGASAVTLSFWVRSSLTGTFGGAVQNSAANRSYPFTYSITNANTWEYKTVTIPGDTTGTWTTDNTIGVRLIFSLGMGSTFSGTAGAWAGSNLQSATGTTSVVGTNGATFYITGVQLERGSAASPFDWRPYGTELALCQRYYEKSYDTATSPGTVATSSFRTVAAATYSYLSIPCPFKVTKRAAATGTLYSPNTGATGKIYNINAGTDINANVSLADSSGLTAVVNGVSVTLDQTCSVHWTAVSEL